MKWDKIRDTDCGFVTNTYSIKFSIVELDILPMTLLANMYYFNQLVEMYMCFF